MRNIKSKRSRKDVIFISQITEIFDPLYLIKSVVNKSLIKQRESLGSPYHNIRLHKSFFETFMIHQLGLWIQNEPHIIHIILGQIILKRYTCVLVRGRNTEQLLACTHSFRSSLVFGRSGIDLQMRYTNERNKSTHS